MDGLTELFPDSAAVENGELTIGGIPTPALAEQFGTPLVVYDEQTVLAAARWRIDDEAFEDRIASVVDRTGHARGRALLVHAEGLRAARRGELGKAEKLLFDAVQAFATLQLDYERAVALADHARVAAALGHGDPQAECDEAKQIAERLGALALRTAAEQVPVPAS